VEDGQSCPSREKWREQACSGIDAITGALWELEPARVERKLVPK
jgi:hypothetical protein